MAGRLIEKMVNKRRDEWRRGEYIKSRGTPKPLQKSQNDGFLSLWIDQKKLLQVKLVTVYIPAGLVVRWNRSPGRTFLLGLAIWLAV